MGWLLSQSGSAQTLAVSDSNAPVQTPSPIAVENSIVLPTGFKDPIEPFNRAMWDFNKGFMTSVVRPFSRGYRFVVVKPVRTGIGNVGKNFTYPGRLANNLLQGRWTGAANETERCLCNAVLGLGGFFDVATKWNIAKSEADFGQTFKEWGWSPGLYLMLPIFGPSDDRDAVGLAGDTAVEPQTYFFPYSLINTGATVNNFSDTVEASVCFSESQADPYSILEYAWSLSHENQKADMRVVGEQDEPTLETLQAVFCTYKNPEFPAHGKTMSVLIPATGRKLGFTFWLQPKHAPIVYLVPGIGAHRLAGNELALAELLYTHGFSAVCVSSSFHPEFMERASTTDLPSYPPIDAQDVQVALTEIDRQLQVAYPHRLGPRALMGYSMGGFQAMLLAAQTNATGSPSIKFERYVAIDTPVRLQYAVTNVDKFYDAALEWPATDRTANIENTLLKVAAVSMKSPEQRSSLPFNSIESRFLIGLAFRLTLRDVIFSSQLRHNQGVLIQPLKKSRRWAAYDEIMRYSLRQYIQKFAKPYDKTRGIDLDDPAVIDKGTDLHAYSAELRGNQNIRIIANRNDLFMAPEDTAWMESEFESGRLKVFEHGGHTGNLCQPEVQRAILEALDGLAAPENQ